jgi:DNA (cytosine-5)-methyltransferase 1
MNAKPVVIDMFSGAGGESCGIVRAYQEAGRRIELHAINHWERAIETHSINHPWAEHHLEPIQNLDPCRVVPGGRAELLWASPECTHHSVARGGRPCSDQSRASAWLVLKWLQELYVERVIIENVPEFENWGPLGADGMPLESRKGDTFRGWIAAIKALGYKVEHRVLNAADYGAPTTRRRLFVQAVRDTGRKRILWPDRTHSRHADLFAENRWRPASEVIDWNLPRKDIFDRSKPLADATLRRIQIGIERYWGDAAKPFLVKFRGTGTVGSIQEPLSTVTSSGMHHGLVAPMIMGQQSGAACLLANESPVPTVATAGAISLICPIDNRSQNGGALPTARPVSTITTKQRHALVVGYYGNGVSEPVDRPVPTVTTRDRFGLAVAQGMDITLRMLTPRELALAQSFPAGYQFSGTQTEQVKQIGNAVPPALSYAQTLDYAKG